MTHSRDPLVERRRDPLTEEQIDLIAHETQRATRKALRAHTRQMAVAYLLIFGAFLWNVMSLNDQDTKIKAASKAGRITGVKESCKADRAFARAIDDALEGQIRFIIAAKEPPPPTIDERVQSINEIRVKLTKIPTCEQRLAKIQAAADDAAR